MTIMDPSYTQKLELTVFGYVRLNYSEDIIDDIKRICLDYYTKIEIIWDVFCDKLAKFISDDRLLINIPDDKGLDDVRSNYTTFASSTGWSQGIHSYALEITPASTLLAVGIMSSEEIPKYKSDAIGTTYFLWTKNKSTIGYGLDNMRTLYQIQNAQTEYINTCRPDFSDNDKTTVTVVIDCDEWKLSIYLDDTIHFENVDIIKDKIYHPIFTEWSHHKTSYKLIETKIDISK